MVDPHQRDAIIRAARDYLAAADETTGWEALADGFGTLPASTYVIRVSTAGNPGDPYVNCAHYDAKHDTPLSDYPPLHTDDLTFIEEQIPVSFAIERDGEEYTRAEAEEAYRSAQVRETQALAALTRLLSQPHTEAPAQAAPSPMAA